MKETLPICIIVHFDKYIGPQFFLDMNRHNWVPIEAISIYSKLCQSTRKQFPIRLAYGMTTHKTQVF